MLMAATSGVSVKYYGFKGSFSATAGVGCHINTVIFMASCYADRNVTGELELFSEELEFMRNLSRSQTISSRDSMRILM
jgi:hypothetical protein